MSVIRQTSFASGELSPYLYGRSDLDLHAHGARKLLNFFVNQQGAAVSRPGTSPLTQAKTLDVALVPFIYSGTTAYVLEFGRYYVRVHHPSDGYLGVELVTPWPETAIHTLQYAQAGTVITITHPDHPPKEIHSPVTVAGLPTAWAIQDCRFGPPGDGAADDSMEAFHVGKDGLVKASPMLVSDISGTNNTLLVTDAAHPAREWKWMVSTLVKHSQTGEEAETLPREVLKYFDGVNNNVFSIPDDNFVVLFPDAGVKLVHPPFGTAPAKPQWWIAIGQNYYRGRGNLFGFIGTTRYAQPFLDLAEEPNYLLPPLRGDSPFARDENPSSVCYFQQRRIWGGTKERPSILLGSAFDDWSNHDAPVVPWPGQPLVFDLLSRAREQIRSMVTMRRLIVFTNTSVWSVGGSEAALDYDSIEARVEDETGASGLQPLVVDGAVLYVVAKGRGVRALEQANNGSYVAKDISWHAEHLFRGYEAQIKSWCFQRSPWSTVWAVRNDGVMLSATNTGNLWAWTKHETNGVVRSIACVPEANADTVIVAVQRGNATWLERMATRDRLVEIPLTIESGDAIALDSYGIGEGSINTRFTVGNLDHLIGEEVWAYAPGNATQGPFTVDAAGEVIVGPFITANLVSGAVKVAVGLRFQCDLETLDANLARTAQKSVVAVGFEVDQATGLAVGQDFDNLRTWRQRSVADSYLFPSAASELVTVKVAGKWAKSGRAVLRQSLPQSVIVLGITRELDVGGA